MKEPAPAAGRERAEASKQHPKSTACAAKNLGSNVVAFGRVPPCEHCGWFVPAGSATEKLHHEICALPRERAERLAETREQWRRADRERLRKSRGMPIRRPIAPLPVRQPHKTARGRLELLRAALSHPEMHPTLEAATRLPLAALERVAAGRSTLAPTTWRRLLVELDR